MLENKTPSLMLTHGVHDLHVFLYAGWGCFHIHVIQFPLIDFKIFWKGHVGYTWLKTNFYQRENQLPLESKPLRRGGGALSSSTCGTNRITRNVFYSLLCQTFLHKTITCFVLNPKADNLTYPCIVGAEDDSITASNQYKHARSYSAALDFLLFYLQLVPWSRLQNFHQRLLQNRALRLE